jgi:hypothetical protein
MEKDDKAGELTNLDVSSRTVAINAFATEEKLYETIVDISLTAGSMITNNEIVVDDSRELIWFIVDAAKAFEHNNPHIAEAYMLRIENYAIKRLKEKYKPRK